MLGLSVIIYIPPTLASYMHAPECLPHACVHLPSVVLCKGGNWWKRTDKAIRRWQSFHLKCMKTASGRWYIPHWMQRYMLYSGQGCTKPPKQCTLGGLLHVEPNILPYLYPLNSPWQLPFACTFAQRQLLTSIYNAHVLMWPHVYNICLCTHAGYPHHLKCDGYIYIHTYIHRNVNWLHFTTVYQLHAKTLGNKFDIHYISVV